MKKYVIFAGVNGAGKTTFYKNDKLQYPLRINSDEILVSNGGDWKNPEDEIAAMRESVRLIKECLRENKSFSQETTLTGKSILKNIKFAKFRGYIIEMFYVGLDSADIAVERVNSRVRKGGHGIPEDEIRKRYTESLRNFKSIIPYCDKIFVYDNTRSFNLLARFYNGEIFSRSDSDVSWFNRLFSTEK
ncbi:MAG: ATPase [Ruminococcus sp.]|nr:ATPase [Ruminococcus sp.]